MIDDIKELLPNSDLSQIIAKVNEIVRDVNYLDELRQRGSE